MNEMDLKEASEYLGLTETQVEWLVGAKEIRGRQQNGTWQLDRVSVIAFKARQQAGANAQQGIEDERKPGGDEDVLRPLDR
jgi:hypothetical protein